MKILSDEEIIKSIDLSKMRHYKSKGTDLCTIDIRLLLQAQAELTAFESAKKIAELKAENERLRKLTFISTIDKEVARTKQETAREILDFIGKNYFSPLLYEDIKKLKAKYGIKE